MKENLTAIFSNLKPFLINGSEILGLAFVGIALQWLFFRLLKVRIKRHSTAVNKVVLKYLDSPTKFFVPILIIYAALPYLDINQFWKELMEFLIIINVAWLFINFINALEEIIKNRYEIDEKNNVRERKLLTQLKFIKNIFLLTIITLTFGIILWKIPGVKELGTGLLTTAGVAGIIVGISAQKTIGNIIAGFQIALTQPIKIDDIVVVEKEWGRVEDITLTYVVIKIWDWRRLVLPINYFNEKPFENWTFNSERLIGKILLYVDYSFPVEKLRQELLTILEVHPMWDKDVAELLVTDTNDRTIELRITFSAQNSSDVWNMRCEIREKLISYIQTNYPDNLPKVRSVSEEERGTNINPEILE